VLVQLQSQLKSQTAIELCPFNLFTHRDILALRTAMLQVPPHATVIASGERRPINPTGADRGAAAPGRRGSYQNIENNPMHSSRRPSQPTVWTEYLTRRANQRHDFIIPKSDERPRARNGCAVR
jgi:hypothetical protein